MTMGLHICPIEPHDWNDGDGNAGEGNCSRCDGTGSIQPSDTDDHEENCPACDGTGHVEPAEPDMSDFI